MIFNKIKNGDNLYCIEKFSIQDSENKFITHYFNKGDKITLIEKYGNFCIFDTPFRIIEDGKLIDDEITKEIFQQWTHRIQLNSDYINKYFVQEIHLKINKLLEE